MECPVCFDTISKKISCNLPCSHQICLNCLIKLNLPKCPICRANLVSFLPKIMIEDMKLSKEEKSIGFQSEIDFPSLS